MKTHSTLTGRRAPLGCLIFIGHFPQNILIISGSFAENDLQRVASYGSSSSCICVMFYEVDTYILKNIRQLLHPLHSRNTVPHLIGHVPPKSPVISGSFAERDLHSDRIWRLMHPLHPVYRNVMTLRERERERGRVGEREREREGEWERERHRISRPRALYYLIIEDLVPSCPLLAH